MVNKTTDTMKFTKTRNDFLSFLWDKPLKSSTFARMKKWIIFHFFQIIDLQVTQCLFYYFFIVEEKEKPKKKKALYENSLYFELTKKAKLSVICGLFYFPLIIIADYHRLKIDIFFHLDLLTRVGKNIIFSRVYLEELRVNFLYFAYNTWLK